ncbi:MAG: hypothetical protein IPO07_27365 [Haliscomenobacter sp.]|nr:hypothetical protein [Haliscomenobacter sp.]MBK9492107.1 hypothetical protein [Haliscomenobacter sp.]
MKKVLLFLLMIPACIFAQQREVFRIDSLPPEGILLDQGWKWHAGDNPEWAKAEFNDSKWEAIDPMKGIFELPQLSKKGEISWFRLYFSLSKTPSQQGGYVTANGRIRNLFKWKIIGALWSFNFSY